MEQNNPNGGCVSTFIITLSIAFAMWQVVNIITWIDVRIFKIETQLKISSSKYSMFHN